MNLHLPCIRNQIHYQTDHLEEVDASTGSHNFIYPTVLEPSFAWRNSMEPPFPAEELTGVRDFG
jgi:hypothetical protein